ncbi:MAG TPA: outer membrane protein assembly factor BamC [Pseudidiomarina sp.]|nr:outer membrane protein assembly factor BamC [Pseudidiomarina sp.]
MKEYVRVLTCLSVVVASGCSFTPQEQADGGFEYTEAELTDGLRPAPNKGLPAPSNRYEVPDVEQGLPIGPEVNIQAPVLVRPTAAGSRIEETEQRVRIYFDELEDMSNLSSFVWQGVTKALNQRGIGIVESSPEQRLVTAKVRYEREVSEDELALVTERQFEITQTTPDHGRTTAIEVNVIESTESGPGAGLQPSLIADRNAAAMLLNDIVNEIAIAQQENRIFNEANQEVIATAGFNADGFPAIVVESDFDTVWALMGQALPELGFSIDDLNQSTGQYFTEYSKGSKGLSSLAFWRDEEAGRLDIADGDYMIRVTGDNETTTVTFHYNEKPLSAAEVNRIYAPIAASLRRQNSL